VSHSASACRSSSGNPAIASLIASTVISFTIPDPAVRTVSESTIGLATS
jgi:hypothetical protein